MPSAYRAHCNRVHSRPQASHLRSTFRFHPHLNGMLFMALLLTASNNYTAARPCNEDGQFLPRNTPPPPLDDEQDWEPFVDRSSFELAELVFEKAELSAGEANQLLRIWAAHQIETTQHEDPPLSELRRPPQDY